MLIQQPVKFSFLFFILFIFYTKFLKAFMDLIRLWNQMTQQLCLQPPAFSFIIHTGPKPATTTPPPPSHTQKLKCWKWTKLATLITLRHHGSHPLLHPAWRAGYVFGNCSVEKRCSWKSLRALCPKAGSQHQCRQLCLLKKKRQTMHVIMMSYFVYSSKTC